MGGLFGNKDKPKVEPPSRMPDRENPTLKAERTQRLEDMRKRGGRDSTIMSEELSGSAGKLGT